jgi:hypothetical protein
MPSISNSANPLSNPPTYVSISSPAKVPSVVHPKLVASVMQLQKNELLLADQERQKAMALANKRGVFSNHRLQKHESMAEKHMANAKRHGEWLQGVTTPAVSSAGMSAR